jgi:WD40 repeat protein/serine/threonine protein kinase/tetratricopeptide (TPR) repeat protein
MAESSNQAKSIFLAAIERHTPGEWPAFLDQACAGDALLRGRVERLLHARALMGSFHEATRPAFGCVPAERLGSRIGPYKLMEQIGEGGMGLVYVAEQQEPVRRRVALKVIKPGMDTRQVIARFEAERQALALMDHPNIARVLDAGATESGRPYFVMELVKGVPITQYCDENKLTPRLRLKLCIDVCQAIQHAHQKGIIHRDVKPSNVLITSHDGMPVVKIIDFGVAKAVGQQLTDKTVYTQLTQFLGTPLYMSPEQAGQSSLDVDTRTDIYALGVLLYELLTGSTPFDETRFRQAACDEIRRIIREEEPPRPSTRVSTLGNAATEVTAKRRSDPQQLSQSLRGELDWIVMKCLEKDRNRRYATASGLAMDLERYLNDEPVLACPPSAWYRFGKFARRNKKSLMMTGGLAGVVLLGIVLLADSNMRIAREQAETTKALTAQTQAKGELEDALKRERHSLYFHRIARADLEWSDANIGRADRILDDCPPEYRHWEWHYLKRLCHSELLALTGHTDTIRSVAISPDGERVASAGHDRTVRIWRVAAGEADREALVLHGHSFTLSRVAFSRDGQRLASCGGDWQRGKPGEAKVWDARTGEGLLNLVGHTNAVGGIAFSPDGKLIATAGWDWTLRIWDGATGTELRSLMHTASLKTVAFSPDGTRLATAGVDGVITLWSVGDWRRLGICRGHQSSILNIAFSPDGERIVSGSWDHTARLWDAHSGVQLLVFSGHKNIVHDVAFSPDGERVVSAGVDGSVKLWHGRSGKEVRTLRGHSGSVLGVDFSPGGHLLVSAGSDQIVKVWDLANDQEGRCYAWADALLPRLAISPDGLSFAAASRKAPARKEPARVHLYEISSGRELLALPSFPGGNACVAYRPDGKQMVTDWGKSARIWDAVTGAVVHTLTGHAARVTWAAFSGDGKLVATASEDGTAKVWDAETGRELQTLHANGGAVTGLAYSKVGHTIATGSADGRVRIWHLTAREFAQDSTANGPETSRAEPRLTLVGHTGAATEVAFSAGGGWLISASEDGSVRIWDTADGRVVHVLARPGASAQAACISPDSKRVAAAYEDGSVMIWDSVTGEEALSMRRQLMRASSVAFTPDGSLLLAGGAPSGGGPQGVKVWDGSARPAENGATGASLRAVLQADARDGWFYRGRRLAAAGNSVEAVAAFSLALELGREGAALRAERGAEYARLKEWAKAAADFAQAVKHQPDDAHLWYCHAAALLGGKNTTDYQAIRAEMLGRFAKSGDRNVASHVLYIAVALPAAEGQVDTLVRLGERGARAFRGNERVLGAALHRAGNYQAALQEFEQAARGFAPRAWDWLFQAMAHYQLGQVVEARQCLDRASRWIERANEQAANGNREAWVGWYEAIETECLRREAEALIGS